jgi:hypothetical protein
MKPKKKTERFIASYLWQGLKIKEKKEKALPSHGISNQLMKEKKIPWEGEFTFRSDS